MNNKIVLFYMAIFSVLMIFPVTDIGFTADNGKGSYIDTHMHLTIKNKKRRGNSRQMQKMPQSGPNRSNMRVPDRDMRGPGRHMGGPNRSMRGSEHRPLERRPSWAQHGSPHDNENSGQSPADELISLMDRYGVNKTLVVLVPAHTGTGEEVYEAARNAVSKYPDRLFLMAGGARLNPMIQETPPARVTDDMKKEFSAIARKVIRDGAKGFGEMLGLHVCMSSTHSYQYASPDHPLYLLLADLAAEYNVPIDLHCEATPTEIPTPENLLAACENNPSNLPATLPAMEKLLDHNRGAKIVWQHIGWDNTGYMTPEMLRKMLNKHPNLYISMRVEERGLQVSSNEPMPNRIVDKNWKIRPVFRKLMEDFSDRIMIGGDEFIGGIGGRKRSPQSFEETWGIMDQLPAELARKIGHDNAARVYNL